jgi:ADP-L-glycero-D-manno-heptose 6-epimerase
LAQPTQWHNLAKRHYAEYVDKEDLLGWLSTHKEVSAIIHMGAISDTTEQDFNKLLKDNVYYSQTLWKWCADKQIPFLYASSAATYGDGSKGYDDASIEELRPLNGYGYSKHFFDQWVLREQEGTLVPPRWAGFKFFNVYGPNEYHKGRMASMVFHGFNQSMKEGEIALFKSGRSDIGDGMQARDFVYVKDAAAVVVHFLLHTMQSGIYNVGTGNARTFADLAAAVQHSAGIKPNIRYIDMPKDLQGAYQYMTEATTQKLRTVGYQKQFMTLEEGVEDYVKNYLLHIDPYC